MNSASIVVMTLLFYYHGNPEPAIIEIFPITVEQCREYSEAVQFIRETYQADGLDLLCTLVGKEI